MKIVKAILIGCMLISTCAACAPAQPEQKTKTFFEQRYTTLSYDEYFSQMRLAKDFPYMSSDEVSPSVDAYFFRGDLGNETLFVIPVDSETEIIENDGLKIYAAPSDTAEEIKVLEHIKEKYRSSSREYVCVTADDEIYSVDLYTGDKFLLYESPTSVSNIDATDDLIIYNTGNTVYRLFRPTGRVDEIPLPIEEGQTLSGGVSILCNMLLRYSTVENPEYTECVAMNPGGRDAEVTCWEKLAEKYGDYVWEQKSYMDASGDFHPKMESILDRMWISENIAYTYDLQADLLYNYNPYRPCPCPYSEICQRFTA